MIRPFAAALVISFLIAPASHSQPESRAPSGAGATRDYWLERSAVLDPADHRSIEAHEIFNRVLAAADRRPGPSPELIILDEQGYPWARSLPDGAIILTSGAVDICFRARPDSDAQARLAFIIGHELSHQVNNDFWHFFFYQGVHPESVADPRNRKTLEEVVRIAKSGDSVSAKELQADQYGLLYASQAGYDVKRIVATDTNFFREWTAATSPGLLEGMVMRMNHPKIEERSAAVLMALQRVVDKLDVFDKGVAAYTQESYTAAKHYFEDFLAVYQSREAYNNVGLVYYQMAAQERVKWKPDQPVFRLSLIIDTATRARKTFTGKSPGLTPMMGALRKTETHQSLFLRWAGRAERYFREAAARDPTYAMARNNLACVHFLKGEFSSAVGELDRALALDDSIPETYNNRAVAYMRMGERMKVDLSEKVEADFERALAISPDYADALFNIAYFYKTTGRDREKEQYARRLAQARPDSELLKLLQ